MTRQVSVYETDLGKLSLVNVGNRGTEDQVFERVEGLGLHEFKSILYDLSDGYVVNAGALNIDRMANTQEALSKLLDETKAKLVFTADLDSLGNLDYVAIKSRLAQSDPVFEEYSFDRRVKPQEPIVTVEPIKTSQKEPIALTQDKTGQVKI